MEATSTASARSVRSSHRTKLQCVSAQNTTITTVTAATAPLRRPIVRYHGGKGRLAPWILRHLPQHRGMRLLRFDHAVLVQRRFSRLKLRLHKRDQVTVRA